jgi:diguanylate cyclase (GGDEF)-like protein
MQSFDTPSGTTKLRTPTDLIEDRDGALWIGTLGNGLLRWAAQARNGSLAEVDVFGKSQGLPTDTIYGIVGDQNGALWISSNRGLTLFDPVSGTSRQFDNRNGLRDSEFHQGARLRSRSGRLLFGGATGLVGFFPGELPINDRPPGVVITARSRDAELASVATGDAAPLIEVSYLDRYLAFDFVGLDFMSPDKNQYRYRLHGFDDGWVEGDDFRRAIYTNLPPGRFSFQVQSANNDGLWNTEGAAVDVVVIPAPWNTWWAYLSYFILATSLLALYLNRQRAELKREARQRMLLEQEVDSRTEELAQRNKDLEALNEKLAEASVTDSLTGLRNRRYVDQFIATEIALFERNQRKATGNPGSTDQREESSTMFFMMIDLDGFKLINDRYGHHAGDLALTQVTSVLQHCSRESDTLIRWGGDEFMVIGFASGFFGAKVLAERIRHSIAERAYDVGNGNMGKLSASIGIAPYPLIENGQSTCSWEQITAIADQAAYIAKANGRNAWVSIVGTDTLDKSMLAELTTDLAEMVQLEHVDIDSSLHGPLLLPGHQETQDKRAAVG